MNSNTAVLGFDALATTPASANVNTAAITAIGTFFAGMWEGIVACRRFEELKSWRVHHDTALRQAM